MANFVSEFKLSKKFMTAPGFSWVEQIWVFGLGKFLLLLMALVKPSIFGWILGAPMSPQYRSLS